MNDSQRLIALGYDLRLASWIQLQPDVMTLILNYHERLRALGFTPAMILDILSGRNQYNTWIKLDDSIPQLLEGICQYAQVVKAKWGISNQDLVQICKRATVVKFLQALDQHSEKLKSYTCRLTHLHRESKNNNLLLINLLCDHSSSILRLNISLEDLASITFHYSNQITPEVFFEHAEIIRQKLGLSLNEWVILCDRSSWSSASFLYVIIERHQDLLKTHLLSKSELLKFGMEKDSNAGLGIRAICKNYSTLTLLGFDHPGMIKLINRKSTPPLLDAMTKHCQILKDLNIKVDEYCLLAENESVERAITTLATHNQILKKLKITSSQFALISNNYNLQSSLRALEEDQASLQNVGITSEQDLALIASSTFSPKNLKAIFDNLALLQTLGFQSPQDIVNLASQSLGYRTIEVLVEYANPLIELGMPNDKIKAMIFSGQFDQNSMAAVLSHQSVFKNELNFQIDDLIKVMQTKRNGAESIKHVADNLQAFKKVPKQILLATFAVDCTGKERISRLTRLGNQYASAPTPVLTVASNSANNVAAVLQASVVSQPAEQLEDEQRIQNLNEIIRMQALALAEMTKANENLIRENAALQNENKVLGQKRANEPTMDEGFQLDVKRAHTSFFNGRPS